MPPVPSAASPHQPASLPSSSARFMRLDHAFQEPFIRFLADLQANGDHAFFHPHGFDAEAARAVVRLAEQGNDEYWLLTEGVDVLGYGMLRGWAEGFAVPSLGLAVAPRHRGRGLARALMHHLHGRARDRGACQVRLKVDRRNLTAQRLYESLGYVLQDHSRTDLLGLLALAHHAEVAITTTTTSTMTKTGNQASGVRNQSMSGTDQTVNESFIPVATTDLGGNEERYVCEAIRSSWISSSGAFLSRFEREFAAACGSRFCLGVSNGTTALHLLLAGMNVQPGDEVIVPSMTYVATANAVRYCGGEPVFIDVDPATWCVTAEAIEAAITPRTRGIVVVHLLGQPADMDPIMRIAGTHGLWVVEDAAEAPFATYKGRLVGSIGQAASFSFYGNKLLTSGEGGAITFQDPHLERRFRMLRGQGMDPDRRYFFPIVGYNFRMTNVAAAILCAQMERREEIVRRRREIWSRYEQRLSRIPGIELRPAQDWAQISPWMFPCVLDPQRLGIDRDDLAARLLEHGIETRPMFVPLHTLPPYRHLARRAPPMPVTDRLGEHGIMLPTFTTLTDAQIDRVCATIQSVAAARRPGPIRHAA